MPFSPSLVLSSSVGIEHRWSAIASFTKLPKTSLDGLRQATAQGGFGRYLQQHGKSVADFEWSGFILATLLPYLDEQQIQLMKSEHDELATFLCQSLQATCFIFTDAHRQAYVGKLAPESFSAQKLGDYYNEFNATDEPDAGQPMLDGIRAFRQSLSALDGDSVIVFCIA